MYEATLRTRKSRTRGKTIGTDLQVSDLRDWTTRLSRNPCGWRQYMERDQEARQKGLYHGISKGRGAGRSCKSEFPE